MSLTAGQRKKLERVVATWTELDLDWGIRSAITAALAEIDARTRECDAWEQAIGRHFGSIDEAARALAERDALKAENERLRALEWYKSCTQSEREAANFYADLFATQKQRDDARKEADTLRALVAEMREALAPFARFIERWNAKPLRGSDRQFYAIHTGTEWEASLSLDDCERARDVLAKGRRNERR